MDQENTKDPRDLNGDGKVSFGEKVQYGLDQASDKLEKAINDVKDGVVESAKDAKQMIEEKMPKVADKAKEVYGEAKEFVKENAP
jgi:ElaB/YqjD/DUF883 family membrane-anchored ribosome-binding protein